MKTITKHIGEGFARGELYAALAFDITDQFGGMQIKQLRFSPASGAIALDFKDAHNGAVIETGTYASAASKGVTLSATNLKPVSFLFDDGGSALTAGNYRAVISRIYLGTDVTADAAIALRCIRGQLTLAAGVDIDISASLWNAVNSVEGYVQLLGNHNFGLNTRVAAVHALLEASGTIGVTSGGVYAGFFAELAIETSATIESGWPVGLLIDRLDSQHTSTQDTWDTGVKIVASSCVTGISVGTCTTANIAIAGTNATGIAMTGTYSVAGISITSSFAATGDYGILVTDTYTKVDGAHNAITGITIYDPAVEGYGWINAVSGKLQLKTLKEFDGGQGGLFGGQFQLDFGESAIMDEPSSIFAGLRGVLTGTTPVLTNASVVACCYLDNLITTNLAGTAQNGASLLAIQNHGGTLDHGISIYGNNKITNIFAFYTCEDAISRNAAVEDVDTPYKMKILIDGDLYYIQLYAAAVYA